MHVDELVNEIHAYADLGVDHFAVHLPSYRYGSFSNQETLSNQMELLAEHVLPKIRQG